MVLHGLRAQTRERTPAVLSAVDGAFMHWPTWPGDASQSLFTVVHAFETHPVEQAGGEGEEQEV